MNKEIFIKTKKIAQEEPVFIIAELSANHNQSFEKAAEIIRQVKQAGADAIKLQTYTADSMTIDCRNPYFQITQGTIWDGKTLYNLYQEAYTPWEWQPALKEMAEKEGLICFSSPFDMSSVDYLEKMDMPAYKIASFEITDIPFVRYVASKRKPVILSTGIARFSDIENAIKVCKEVGNKDIMLLKCSSAYPTPFEDIHLKTIPHMREAFDVITGLSDHTLGAAVALGAVALGAKIIEKHVTLKRSDGGPDAAFSMEISEFAEMISQVRSLEKALGCVTYDLTEKQLKSREHARSLFVVKDIKRGERFSKGNIRSIRPSFGLSPQFYDEIIGKTATQDIKFGTPLEWGHIE